MSTDQRRTSRARHFSVAGPEGDHMVYAQRLSILDPLPHGGGGRWKEGFEALFLVLQLLRAVGRTFCKTTFVHLFMAQ